MLCSKWMENGNAINYVKRVDHVDRRYLVCICIFTLNITQSYAGRQVRKIAEGLNVLHSFEPPLMHGYIRGVSTN